MACSGSNLPQYALPRAGCLPFYLETLRGRDCIYAHRQGKIRVFAARSAGRAITVKALFEPQAFPMRVTVYAALYTCLQSIPVIFSRTLSRSKVRKIDQKKKKKAPTSASVPPPHSFKARVPPKIGKANSPTTRTTKAQHATASFDASLKTKGSLRSLF